MSAEALPIIWIVEDDERLSKVLRRTLSSAGFETECFLSAESFLQAYDPSRPGCILLDVRLPGDDGLRLQDRLLERNATTPIVFMSGHADVRIAVRALQAGAMDLLQKPFRRKDLLAALSQAVERDLQQHRREAERRALRARVARLTPREREVFDLLLTNCSTKEIAAALDISPRTVEIHRQRVMHKMGVHSAAALVRLFLGADPTPPRGRDRVVRDAATPAREDDEPAGRGNRPRSG